jgi:hypothetical protein
MVCALWLVVASASAFAQGRDLAGTWTPDAERNRDAPRGGGGAGTGGGLMKGGSGGAGDLTITLDKASFTIERTSGGSSARTVYRLDGKQTVNGEGPTAWRSRATWNADTLVVSMTRHAEGAQSQTMKYFLENGELVQQVSRPAAGGRPAVASKTYYRRKASAGLPESRSVLLR